MSSGTVAAASDLSSVKISSTLSSVIFTSVSSVMITASPGAVSTTQSGTRRFDRDIRPVVVSYTIRSPGVSACPSNSSLTAVSRLALIRSVGRRSFPMSARVATVSRSAGATSTRSTLTWSPAPTPTDCRVCPSIRTTPRPVSLGSPGSTLAIARTPSRPSIPT